MCKTPIHIEQYFLHVFVSKSWTRCKKKKKIFKKSWIKPWHPNSTITEQYLAERGHTYNMTVINCVNELQILPFHPSPNIRSPKWLMLPCVVLWLSAHYMTGREHKITTMPLFYHSRQLNYEIWSNHHPALCSYHTVNVALNWHQCDRNKLDVSVSIITPSIIIISLIWLLMPFCKMQVSIYFQLTKSTVGFPFYCSSNKGLSCPSVTQANQILLLCDGKLLVKDTILSILLWSFHSVIIISATSSSKVTKFCTATLVDQFCMSIVVGRR